MTKEYKISDENFWDNINSAFEKRGGVYKLFCKKKNEVVEINRLIATDKDGVLYIGKANSFLDRVIELKKSLSPKHFSSQHECGYRWKNHPNISKKFTYENLYIQLTSDETPLSLEKQMLNKYEKEFGELPPLNRNK